MLLDQSFRTQVDMESGDSRFFSPGQMLCGTMCHLLIGSARSLDEPLAPFHFSSNRIPIYNADHFSFDRAESRHLARFSHVGPWPESETLV